MNEAATIIHRIAGGIKNDNETELDPVQTTSDAGKTCKVKLNEHDSCGDKIASQLKWEFLRKEPKKKFNIRHAT